MECVWEGCGQYITENITTHINAHIEKQTIYTCMWKGCKRYNEKQSSKYTLQAHVRKHTNERPFQCTKCVKQYTRSDALNKHIKNHQKVEEETENLVTQLEIMSLRKEIAVNDLKEQCRFRERIIEDIQVAYQCLYENVYAKISSEEKDKKNSGDALWTVYLKR